MNIHKLNGFIYVTSEDKPIDRNYCFDKFNQLWKLEDKKLISFDSKGIKRFSTDNILGHECRKIILTNDSYLANVQKLTPEEEAYCKTVDSVEVVKKYITPLGDIVDTCYDNERLAYQLQLPKQETIEEVAYNYAKNKTNRTSHLIGFREGYNHAVKALYTAQQVLEMLLDLRSENPIDVEKWFNQNKKK